MDTIKFDPRKHTLLNQWARAQGFNLKTTLNAAKRGAITGAIFDETLKRWIVRLDCQWKPLPEGRPPIR